MYKQNDCVISIICLPKHSTICNKKRRRSNNIRIKSFQIISNCINLRFGLAASIFYAFIDRSSSVTRNIYANTQRDLVPGWGGAVPGVGEEGTRYQVRGTRVLADMHNTSPDLPKQARSCKYNPRPAYTSPAVQMQAQACNSKPRLATTSPGL